MVLPWYLYRCGYTNSKLYTKKHGYYTFTIIKPSLLFIRVVGVSLKYFRCGSICSMSLFWFEYLQHVLTNWWRCFLNLLVFFSICMCFFKLQRVELSRPPHFYHFIYRIRQKRGHFGESEMVWLSNGYRPQKQWFIWVIKLIVLFRNCRIWHRIWTSAAFPDVYAFLLTTLQSLLLFSACTWILFISLFVAPAEMCLFLDLLLMLDWTGEGQKLYWVMLQTRSQIHNLQWLTEGFCHCTWSQKSFVKDRTDACFNRAAASIDRFIISLHDHSAFSYEKK